MYLFYSFLYTLAFLAMAPLFVLRRQKYAAGFWQRLGYLPEFKQGSRPVVWLHCVSVGETNAARPLVEALLKNFPDYHLVISTTTKSGQALAAHVFKNKTDAIFYFPFDWKFSVQKALRNFNPSAVLLMETEIWPRFIREAGLSGAKIAIVNGRLSDKSIRRFIYAKSFVRKVLMSLDLALMQSDKDARRIQSLGMAAEKIEVTGNLKYDHALSPEEDDLTEVFRERFGISKERTLIIAASTHEDEEKWLLESLKGKLGANARLMIAPRHPERFADIAELLDKSSFSFVKRTDKPSVNDKLSEIILLDSIGELRAVYPLSEIVFVGGSLIPHGGQSIIEPAAAGKAIVTGPYTSNFEAVVKQFLDCDAIIQLPEKALDNHVPERLSEIFTMLLLDKAQRRKLGANANALMDETNRGATGKTIEALRRLLAGTHE